MHLGSFRNCMRLVAKHTELVQLMQKFVPRSRIGIFRNERIRSTPLVPKLMSWCVSQYLGAFGFFRYCMKVAAKRSELEQLMQKFVPRSSIGIFRNERTRFTPLDLKHMFWCVLWSLGGFGSFHYCMKPGAKWAELVQLMQKFVPKVLSEFLH